MKNKWKITMFLSILFIFSFYMMNYTSAQTPSATRVLYLVGDPNYATGYEDSPIKALKLDSVNIQLTVMDDSSSIDFGTQTDYDVIVINDYNLTIAEITALNGWLATEGHGLMVIMGKTLTTGNLILDQLGITPGITNFQENDLYKESYEEQYHSVVAVSKVNSSSSNSILKSIAWNSAVELVNYTQFPNIDTITGNEEYIYMRYYNGSDTSNSLVFGRSLCGSYNNIIVYAGWFTNGINTEFQLWPYFNYLMFNSIQSIAGKTFVSYKDWKYSPVPHLFDQIILGLFVLCCIIIAVLLFKKQRQKGKPKRLEYETLELIEKEIHGKEISIKTYLESKGSLNEVEARLLNAQKQESNRNHQIGVEEKRDHWEEIGFHRQQAGFLQTIYSLIFIIIPQLVMTSFVMPMFIQPHPQAGGYYSYTLHFFEAIWVLFDLGLQYSFVKYFSAHRIERPEKAYHYVQIFVWWQILSGLVQICMVAFVGSFVFPMTNLSYLTWMFIVHSLIQFPGFFRVFEFFFQGMQRNDKQMITFVLQMFLMRLICQIALVPVFRAIYGGIPMYGDAFGAGIGLLLGQYVGDIIIFLITIKWYKQLKLSFKPIIAAEFTKQEFIESIKFGAKMAAGSVWVPAVWMLQVVLVSSHLPNYAAEQGYYELAYTITQIPAAATLIYEGVLGGLTEAWTYNKKTLLNYISGASMRLGFFWTSFLCCALWAIGPTFIIGTAGQGWARAADFVWLFVLFQLLGPFSWQGDKEFAASDHPGYAGIAWIIEQGLRAILLFILVPTMQIMESVIIAYMIALTVKDIFIWVVIETKIHKHTWNIWPTFISPAISGALIYLLLKVMEGYAKNLGLIGVLILFVATFFVVLFVYSFLNGFFGGYDDNTIAEFQKSANMVVGVGGLARGLYKCAKLGTKISPLHGKFPVKEYIEAYKEADELTAIKKSLVIK